MILSTGREVLHRTTENGATEAYFADGSEMTSDEWNEYCDRLHAQRSAERIAKLGTPIISGLSGRPGHPGFDRFSEIAASWGYD